MITFQDVEDARLALKKKSQKIKIPVYIYTVLVISFFVYYFINNLTSEDVVIKIIPMLAISAFPLSFGLVVELLLLQFTAKKEREAYKKTYKDFFVKTALESTFESVNYSPEKGLSRNKVLWPGFIKEGNSFSSEDYFSAKYRDAELEGSDVLIQFRSDDGTTTYFDGAWMIFHLNSPLPNFQIIKKGFYYAAQKGVGTVERDLDWIDENAPEPDLEESWSKEEKRAEEAKKSQPPFIRLKFEDKDFKNLYKIFSQNEFEARSFFSPERIEKLKNLAISSPLSFMAGAIENELYLAVSLRYSTGYNALFDPKSYKPINEDLEREKIKGFLKNALDIFNLLISK